MARIVIFDSGVGGLSIYQEVVSHCPNHEYIFVCDNQAFPYGTKTELDLTERVLNVVRAVNKQYLPDLVIIACNSASTIALNELRANFSIPFVGVVPAIKPAAKLSDTKVIGLLATPGTITRPYTQDLINQFASNCRVIKVGSSKLVEFAEQKMTGQEVNLGELETELTPFLEEPDLDTLVLACTHFPLLNNELSSVFNARCHPVSFVDSGKAIANRVAELGAQLEPSNSSVESMSVFTGNHISNELLNYLQGIGLGEARTLVV